MRSQIHRTVGLMFVAMLALSFTGSARNMTVPAKGQDAKVKSMKTINANAWKIYTTNWGSFVMPVSGSGGFWGGPGYSYIYGAGMWVGATDAGGTPHVALGYYPNNGSSEMGPVNPFTGDWINWASDQAARTYLSTDPTDLAEWPLKDAQGGNLIKSVQDGYAVYSDENPAFTFTGETKVGVRIRQHSYAWNYADNNDIVFFYFRVINVSGHTLNGVYIGPCFDADVGNERIGNDLTDFDYTRNMAIQFQTESEPGYPKIGYFGCRYFESPVNNTGKTINIIDNEFPHPIAPGDPLGMTAFKLFTIDIDPP
ncbi:MAG: hypothetical protein QME74_03765, partial [Candidatus Edwardsbacteria bacterium]|nr:hypothetical protein [Candidatus Edwardsbacteria bacterium]